MEFWNGLRELLFSQGGSLTSHKDILYGIFAVGSSIMGMLVVLLDIMLFYATKRSALNLTHKGLNSVLFILLWGLGAGLGSFLGAAAGILQINRAACLSAGIGWPFILPRLIEGSSVGALEDEQEEEEE